MLSDYAMMNREKDEDRVKKQAFHGRKQEFELVEMCVFRN